MATTTIAATSTVFLPEDRDSWQIQDLEAKIRQASLEAGRQAYLQALRDYEMCERNFGRDPPSKHNEGDLHEESGQTNPDRTLSLKIASVAREGLWKMWRVHLFQGLFARAE